MEMMNRRINIFLYMGIGLIAALYGCVTPNVETKSEVKEEKILARNSLEYICKERGIPYPPQNLQLVLNKSEERLDLQLDKTVLKSYKVAIGERIDAPRLYQGDNATPEGFYKILLKQKSENERSILLNYPTTKDMEMYKKAVIENMIPKDEAGEYLKVAAGIKIFPGDISKATDGSIAVSPEEFKELYAVVKMGAPVTIERGDIGVAKTEEAVGPQIVTESKVTGLKPEPSIKPIDSSATPSVLLAPVIPELSSKVLIPPPVVETASIAASSSQDVNQTKQALMVKPKVSAPSKKNSSKKINSSNLVSPEKKIEPYTKKKSVTGAVKESLPEHIEKTSPSLNAGEIPDNSGILSFKKPLFKVTDKAVRNIEPRFSPDGKYISFSRIDRVYNDVWIWDRDANKTRRITLEREDLKEETAMKGARFSYGGIWGNDPEKMLLVSSFKGNYDVYLYDLEADKFVAITDNRAWDGNPSWSPDGDFVAFVSGRKGNGDIWLKKIGRYYFSKEFQLTDNPGIDFGPVWSKDSKKVFYTSRQFENYDIYVIDTDEQIPIRLTFKESADRYVSISPSGKKIAFFSDFNISVMDLEGIDFASLEIQTDPNGWPYKEISYLDAEKRTTLIIPNVIDEIKELRGGRAVTYKKSRQFMSVLTSIQGPVWTTDESTILFIANKPLKPIYGVNLSNLNAKDNSNIYEIETESEIHSDLNLSANGKYLVHSTFRNDYSKFNNNISLVEFTNPPKQKNEIRLIAKSLPEFLIKKAKTWYQITNPPPQDISFINRGRIGLISGNGVVGVKGGR